MKYSLNINYEHQPKIKTTNHIIIQTCSFRHQDSKWHTFKNNKENE